MWAKQLKGSLYGAKKEEYRVQFEKNKGDAS